MGLQVKEFIEDTNGFPILPQLLPHGEIKLPYRCYFRKTKSGNYYLYIWMCCGGWDYDFPAKDYLCSKIDTVMHGSGSIDAGWTGISGDAVLSIFEIVNQHFNEFGIEIMNN